MLAVSVGTTEDAASAIPHLKVFDVASIFLSPAPAAFHVSCALRIARNLRGIGRLGNRKSQ